MAQIKDGKLIFKVATYNLAAEHYCKDHPELLAFDIRDSGADIVGLQEVDLFTRRTGERDMLAELAEKAGYPHRRFVRAIDFQGGQYGTAILSKHPIEEMELRNLDSTNEKRSIGRFKIDVLGEKINYFNTHLSYVPDELLSHLDQVAKILDNYESYIITADFNTNNFSLFNIFHGHRLANNAENELLSYHPSGAGIDNIIMTEDFDYSEPRLGTKEHSDHCMLSAVIVKEVK